MLFLLEAELYRSEHGRVDTKQAALADGADKASESREPARTDRAEMLGRAADIYARFVGGADSTLPLSPECRRRLLWLGERQSQPK